jgi:prepilin-type N-terminal cleavage/methylation domain-containing protein
MRDMTPETRGDSGFSLPELLVGMVLGTIVVALIVTAYLSQAKTGSNQQQMVEMQQNVRSGLFFMQRDIMMAGFGENTSEPSGASFTIAEPTRLEFTYADPIMDDDGINNDGDGDTDEAEEKDGIDNNGDGEEDEVNELETVQFVLQGTELHRIVGAGRQDDIIANNIDRLEFLYTQDDGDASPPLVFDNQDARDAIRKVSISILARSEFAIKGYTNTQTYTTLSGAVWDPASDANPDNDQCQMELVTTTIVCRNMVKP